jgi:hypothetical protein
MTMPNPIMSKGRLTITIMIFILAIVTVLCLACITSVNNVYSAVGSMHGSLHVKVLYSYIFLKFCIYITLPI